MANFSVSPKTITFKKLVGGTLPPPQTVKVTVQSGKTWHTSDNIQFADTHETTSHTNSGTFTLTPSSGMNNYNTPGTYPLPTDPPANRQVSVISSGATLNVPVTLIVSSPLLSVSPTSLSFAETVGGTIPSLQKFNINISSGATWSIVGGLTFATISPLQGTGPTTVTVTPNNTIPPVGNYNQSILVSSASNSVVLPVNLTVAAAPQLTVSPSGLSFNEIVGGAIAPAQKITISPSGSTWTIGSGLSFATVAPLQGTGVGTATVSLNSTMPPAGSYSQSLIVSSGSDSVNLPVNLTVTAIPQLTVSPSSLSFNETGGGTIAPAQKLTISPSGSTWTVSGGLSFATASPLQGIGIGTTTVSLNSTVPPTGSYSQSLTVSSGSDSVLVPVNLTVSTTTEPSYIITPFDKIPNFGANPTITSAIDGNWSNPATWSTGQSPQPGAVVSITKNVIYDASMLTTDAVKTVAIQQGGKLSFPTNVPTTLYVSQLLVIGELAVGTPSAPITSTASVIIANKPLDLISDPEQYGNSLIVLGKITMCGNSMTTTFIRVAAEPKLGQTTITLSQAPTGWKVGDKVMISDTRQLFWNQKGVNYVSQLESLTIASISGTTITLSAPLKFDHLGQRNLDGTLKFLPHIANLTRNVVFKSESASGTRGMAMFTYRADVDVRYSQFGGLGRTRSDGTTREYRNGVLFHHLFGPTIPQSNGHQYTFIGNNVSCPLNPMPWAWGVTINDSHYGLIQNNTIYNWSGAGLATSEGSESYNTIENNFVIGTTGNGQRVDDNGMSGSGYWFHNTLNYIRNNVATNSNSGSDSPYCYGFDMNNRYVANQKIPIAQGSEQTTLTNMYSVPILEFSDNETYGATASGMAYWWINTAFLTPGSGGPSIIKNLSVWNQWAWGIFGYESCKLVFDGFVSRGNNVAPGYVGATGLFFGDYMDKDLTIINADIQALDTGISPPVRSVGTFTVKDSYLANTHNIQVQTLYTSAPTAEAIPPRDIVIDNVKFGSTGSTLNAISMGFNSADLSWRPMNLTLHDAVKVYNYNGVVGDNFQVYYNQQAASFIVPQTVLAAGGGPRLIGSPVAGLTNQQLWDQYGQAIAGAVAPSTATTRVGINGLVV